MAAAGTFDEQVRDFLGMLEAKAAGPLQIDVEGLRRHFLKRLRELQVGVKSKQRVEDLHEQWSRQIEAFGRHIEIAGPKVADLDGCSRRLLDVALGLPSKLPLVDQLEAKRVLESFRPIDPAVAQYVVENRLVRVDAESRVTALGRTFLKLRGKDAVRWLLTVETTQSRGTFDDWRTPLELLRDLANHELQASVDEDGEPYFSFGDRTLERLAQMGVVWRHTLNGHDATIAYSIRAEMRDVVTAVLEPGPWHAAAAALIEDERSLVINSPTGSSASEAASEQSRLIAHEVRNALVPVRHHVDELLLNPALKDLDRIGAIRRGVVRTLRFVDEMVATSELTAEPRTGFDVSGAMREALSLVEGGERVEQRTSSADVRIVGMRSRFVRALVNVILNALQATPEAVMTDVRHENGRALISVDDQGPGIPVELRARVFDDGVTTRKDGTGFGLAFAKRVVEELDGTISYEESSLGGARFVLTIPEARS